VEKRFNHGVRGEKRKTKTKSHPDMEQTDIGYLDKGKVERRLATGVKALELAEKKKYLFGKFKCTDPGQR
jgi:hypothetical protein